LRQSLGVLHSRAPHGERFDGFLPHAGDEVVSASKRSWLECNGCAFERCLVLLGIFPVRGFYSQLYGRTRLNLDSCRTRGNGPSFRLTLATSTLSYEAVVCEVGAKLIRWKKPKTLLEALKLILEANQELAERELKEREYSSEIPHE
jgi:hypothetical protein